MNYDYLYTLIQSASLELAAYLILMPIFITSSHRLKIVEAILPMNAITHAIFFFLIMGLPINFLSNILIGEILVIIVEALMLRKLFLLNLSRALILSTLANLVSWQLGPILTYWIKS
jgi:hypothetical protein